MSLSLHHNPLYKIFTLQEPMLDQIHVTLQIQYRVLTLLKLIAQAFVLFHFPFYNVQKWLNWNIAQLKSYNVPPSTA